MSDLKEALAQIKARAEEATGGPWEVLKGSSRGTILRGCEGDAFERGSEGWWMTGGMGQLSSRLVAKHAPFTVLYLP